MGFLIFLGLLIALFLGTAFVAFILRDKTGNRGYKKPSSCPKCQEDPDLFE
jgi:hypothetical protein